MENEKEMTNDQRYGRDKSYVKTPEEFFDAWIRFGERHEITIARIAHKARLELGELDPDKTECIWNVLEWERSDDGEANPELADRIEILIRQRFSAKVQGPNE